MWKNVGTLRLNLIRLVVLINKTKILNLSFQDGDHSALEMEARELETSALMVSIKYIDIDIDIDISQYFECLIKDDEHSALEMEERGLETCGLMVSIQHCTILLHI